MQENSEKCLENVADLNLTKSSDKEDRRELLHAAEQWIQDAERSTIQETMGTLRVKAKGKPTGYYRISEKASHRVSFVPNVHQYVN